MDADHDLVEATPSADAPALPRLAWPPPGLERMQGDASLIIRRLALGGLVLVLPLLWAVGTEQDAWSAGPFGVQWGIVAGTTLVGILFLLTGWGALGRVLQRSAAALDRGYGWRIIMLVVTDHSRDAGFVLQGARVFSTLDAERRRDLLHARLTMAAALLAASLWLPFGFALAIVLAATGWTGTAGVWLVTLGPPALLLVIAVTACAMQNTLVRQARRTWFKRPWNADLEQQEARSWQQAFAASDNGAVIHGGRSGSGRQVRIAVAAGVGALLLALFAPVMLVGTFSVSSVLVRVATPNFGQSLIRAAAVETLRPYVLETDPAVTPLAAGQALHALSFVGRTTPLRGFELEPARRYEQPWSPREQGNLFDHGNFTSFGRARAGLSADERAVLTEIAAHPAHDEFETLARAASIDAAAVLWPSPLPANMKLIELPIPAFGITRESAYAQIARAALLLADGQTDAAELTIRQIISVGLLLAEQSATLIENLMGMVIAEIGGDALAAFYEATGQLGAAAALRASMAAARMGAERVAASFARPDPAAMLAGMPRIVTDEGTINGLRWELFASYNTVGLCTNMHRIVFGPDAEYDAWRAKARNLMVRYDSEVELFDLASRGWFATTGVARPRGMLARMMGLPFGGRGLPGSCAHVLEGLTAVR